jgi:hypothetical protein
MILYKGGEDIPVRTFNSSTVYCNGSTHKTHSWGDVTVIAQESRYYTKTNDNKTYKYFIVQFGDGTKVQASMSHIKQGKVKNPNKPSISEVGYEGQGMWLATKNGEKTKEYKLWERMLHRCYGKSHIERCPTYKEVVVDVSWLCFQNFCDDILHLKGYKEWKENKLKNAWQLDKDIKIKGNKIYSKYKCMFIPQKENLSRYNKKQSITGLTYIATRLSNGHTEEFVNQSEFADKYNLNIVTLCRCCGGRQKTTGGWKIEVKGAIIYDRRK